MDKKVSKRRSKTLAVYKAFFAYKSRLIKALPKKSKRFWARVRLILITPWCLVLRWLKRNPSAIVVFLIVLALVSSSVWGFYLGAAIVGFDSDAGKWLVGVGSAVWAWWLVGPGSPFMGICLALTVAIEALFKKIKSRRIKNGKKQENEN